MKFLKMEVDTNYKPICLALLKPTFAKSLVSELAGIPKRALVRMFSQGLSYTWERRIEFS
jgi:hypothetical protein